MNKQKLLYIAVITLLVINTGMVLLLFLNKQGPPPHAGPRNMIIERLHFDENQVEKYQAFIDWHRSEINKKDREILDLKNELYLTLGDSNAIAEKDSLLTKLAVVQSEIEKIHYQHFEDIRTICTPEQLVYFNDLVKDMASLFSPGKGKK